MSSSNSSISYFKVPVEIEAKFYDENEENFEFYRGTVTHVHRFSEDYVVCDVTYDDGEIIPNSVFYEEDFEAEDSEDTWRFVNLNSKMIKTLNVHTDQIQELKENIDIVAEEKTSNNKNRGGCAMALFKGVAIGVLGFVLSEIVLGTFIYLIEDNNISKCIP
jgi:hypothetical protein